MDFEDVTSGGRLFHVFAAATGNARSLIVDRRVSGTAIAEVDDQRRPVEHQPGRLTQVHEHTCRPAQKVCTLLALAHEARADGKAAVSYCHIYQTGRRVEPLHS